MKKIFIFNLVFIFSIISLAYAQSGKAKASSQYISKSQAEALVKETLQTIQGYTLKEIKEIKKKRASSYEAVLSDTHNGTNLSFFITNKGLIIGPALNGELMKAPIRKTGDSKIKDAEQAEMAVKEYIANYKGFVIDGVTLIPKGPNDTEKAKKFNVMVKDKHGNTYFVKVTPSGVRPQGLVPEAMLTRNEALISAEDEDENKAQDSNTGKKATNEKNIVSKDKKVYKDKKNTVNNKKDAEKSKKQSINRDKKIYKNKKQNNKKESNKKAS